MTHEELELQQNEALINIVLQDDRFAGALAFFVGRDVEHYRNNSVGHTMAGNSHAALVAAAKAAGVEEFWAQLQEAARRYQDRKTSGA